MARVLCNFTRFKRGSFLRYRGSFRNTSMWRKSGRDALNS